MYIFEISIKIRIFYNLIISQQILITFVQELLQVAIKIKMTISYH
jgi:hypothetical protein